MLNQVFAECDSLADGDQRRLREDGKPCECKEGWGGINCNGKSRIYTNYRGGLTSVQQVCETDKACVGFPLAGGISTLDVEQANMTCYTGGETVFNNHQMCDVTSMYTSITLRETHCQLVTTFADRKIVDMLPGRPPQVTFSCDKLSHKCDFQFWTAQVESFYCALDQCSSENKPGYNANTTIYACDLIKCRCIPGRFICGEDGSVGESCLYHFRSLRKLGG